MDEPSLGLVAAIAAVIASTVGGLLALGGVVVQERLAAKRLVRQSQLDETREARRRLVDRQLTTMADTKRATDDIYVLIMTWGFAADASQLREARAAAGPSAHPRADWVYVDRDSVMIDMLAATRAVFEAGRGGAVWERHAPAVLMAYNGVIGALLRQEDRIHDGMADLPTLSENGQTAFLEWIPLVEQMRMVP